MIIDCISDLHGFYQKLEGGDLLIVAGDLTAKDTLEELHAFNYWLLKQDYEKIVFIAGNHDNKLQNREPRNEIEWEGTPDTLNRIVYLCDSGTEFEGLKIWG